MEAHAPNPRAPRRRSSAELTRAVRSGRRLAEALTALGFAAHDPDPDDRALADELARVLVRRADTRHEGWRSLRQALLQAGAEPPWARCERQAIKPTSQRVLSDCATPGRTPLVRVQHAAAQELARTLVDHTEADAILSRLLEDGPAGVTDADWERALVTAVTARSPGRVAALIADALTR